MSENAPGQLLGYTIQYPRALCHLLRAKQGSSVCIEVHGDVATLNANGTIDAEEDKSSINSNPTTDKSINLWKTFYNWIHSINTNELDLKKTTFILYKNKSGNSGIAESFDEACTLSEAQHALIGAKQKLKDIAEDHPIWPYYKYAALDNPTILEKVIVNFHLEIGINAGFSDVENAVRAKHVPASQVHFIIAATSGWLMRKVSEMISAKQPAIITWEEFDHEFVTFFDRARRRELIDFTLDAPPSSDEIESHLNQRPTYLKQVEFIDGSDDELLEAATDFLRAKINRDKWIESEVIDERLAEDFENKLTRYWSSTHKKLEITHNQTNEKDRGKLLMGECMVRVETIGNESPPASTIQGTYHLLADQPVIGWHPNWSSKFKK